MNKTTVAPVTDDAELAKVLEDMNKNMAAAAPPVVDTTTPPPPADPAAPAPVDPIAEPNQPAPVETPELQFEESPVAPLPAIEPAPAAPVTVAPLSGPYASDGGDLESIKKDALTELRPLVDKLDLPAEEKFNTLLLIIRSTDDKSLVPAVHDAAKAIEDETKRAQALLDVIKEIDFFSNPGQ
ncbi:MAG: hypothetical protein ACM3MA_02690 [Acidobacteriota bacterium]